MKTRPTRYFAFLTGFSLLLISIIAGHAIIEHANPLNTVAAHILTCTILALGSMFGGGMILWAFQQQ